MLKGSNIYKNSQVLMIIYFFDYNNRTNQLNKITKFSLEKQLFVI